MEEYIIENGHRDNGMWKKSNELITSKYSATILENQLFCLGLKEVREEGGEFVATLSAADIKARLGEKDYHSFYTQLKKTSLRMLKFNIMMENEKRTAFHAVNLISDVKYDDGVYQIFFNKKFKDFFGERLIKKYTFLNIETMLKFKSSVSLRLYEILKSQCYAPKEVFDKMAEDGVYRLRFGVNELRCMLGCVDTSIDKISDLFQGNTRDYDYIMERIKEIAEKEKDPLIKKRITPKWDTWRNFKRVLSTSLEEINEKTELYVEMEYKSTGKKTKIGYIYFVVNTNAVEKKENATDEDVEEPVKEERAVDAIEIGKLLNLIEQVMKITNSDFTLEECKLLLETSNYDVEKVKKAYSVYSSAKNVDNSVGYMVRAIKEGWETPKAKSKKGSSGYQQTQYDFEALQKMIDEG